jgi:hypothetical protein
MLCGYYYRCKIAARNPSIKKAESAPIAAAIP